MLKRLVCTAVFLMTSSFSIAADPTAIDIVRASNAYANAKVYFLNQQNQQAWDQLIVARENLKGKTNKDLEFMEIMTLYQLKRYSPAYDSILQYFESPPWREQRQAFRNVDTLYDDDVDYEAELTLAFTNLEKWADLQKNIDPTETGTIVGKSFAVQLKADIRYHLEHITLPSINWTSASSYRQRYRSSIKGHVLEKTNRDGLGLRIQIKVIGHFEGADSVGDVTSRSGERNYYLKIAIDLESMRSTASFESRGRVYWNDELIQGMGLMLGQFDYGRKMEREVDFNTAHRLSEAEKLAYDKDPPTFKSAFFAEFFNNF